MFWDRRFYGIGLIDSDMASLFSSFSLCYAELKVQLFANLDERLGIAVPESGDWGTLRKVDFCCGTNTHLTQCDLLA